MEAWILHIRTETYQEAGGIYVDNKYTAWMNEKQAYKAVAKYLKTNTTNYWAGPFVRHDVLYATIKTLVEVEKIEEAIELVNHYSEATLRKSGETPSSKVQITITKSTFLGSPFD